MKNRKLVNVVVGI